mmetsp:Transcript_10855/g.32715  ORF Transcript_10855/g.32715 Transcript_10855/m.32715 type:complete len:206 (+) Transcript_10855:397-1014(+)
MTWSATRMRRTAWPRGAPCLTSRPRDHGHFWRPGRSLGRGTCPPSGVRSRGSPRRATRTARSGSSAWSGRWSACRGTWTASGGIWRIANGLIFGLAAGSTALTPATLTRATCRGRAAPAPACATMTTRHPPCVRQCSRLRWRPWRHMWPRSGMDSQLSSKRSRIWRGLPITPAGTTSTSLHKMLLWIIDEGGSWRASVRCEAECG